jgi:hypothetical protein
MLPNVLFLVDTDTLLPHFKYKWLQSLCGRFGLEDYHVPPIQRIGNSHIRDTVLASSLFNPRQICQINYFRLYLQVITVSDICDGHHDHLEPDLYCGLILEKCGKTTWHSFQQE